MENNKHRQEASENLQPLPLLMRNKSSLPTGHTTAENRKTAATALPSINTQQLRVPQQTQQPRQHRSKSAQNQLHLW